MKEIKRLLGSGGSDGGKQWHMVHAGCVAAICGRRPKPTKSMGWSKENGEVVTCPKCLKRIEHGR